MQVSTSLQTDNHASTPPLSFLQAGCPSCRPTNSVKALKAKITAKQLSVIRKEVAGKLETPKDVSDSQYILSASTGLVGKLSTA